MGTRPQGAGETQLNPVQAQGSVKNTHKNNVSVIVLRGLSDGQLIH